jgi:hypothetical protein
MDNIAFLYMLKQSTFNKNSYFMKHSLSILAVLLFIAFSSKAAVLTVSNTSPSPGQYIALADAVAAASAGDTLYVQGSAFNYNSVTITKKLTLIGTGHHVPNQNPLTSDIDYVYLADGSDGSSFIGLNLYYFETQAADIDSITVTRCRFRYQIRFNQAGCDRWVIDGNVFDYTAANIMGQNQDMDYMTIKNNIFNGYLQDFNYYGNCTNLYVLNNIFLHSSIAFSTLYYAYAYNNIFYRATPNSGANGTTFENNMSYQCGNNAFPNGTNYENVDPKFVSFPNAGASFTYSHNFKLQGSSPAIAAGNDGLDLGVYGGVGNFEQNGIPAIPQIRSFNIGGVTTVAPGATLNLNIITTIKQ